MSIKWRKTKYSGVQFYHHNKRKHGVKFDHYFRGRFMDDGKSYNMAFGWSSEGWTAKSAFIKLQAYKNNAKIGSGSKTIKEEKTYKDAQNEEKARLLKIKETENITFSDYYEDIYILVAKISKKYDSWRKEIEHCRNWLKSEVGHIPIRKISPFNLEKIKKNMIDADKAQRTIQYCFATFRQIWNHTRQMIS